MYGAEYGVILGKKECPRCGSEASLRGLKRKNTQIITVTLVCNKCHNVEVEGFTSTASIAYNEVKTKLEELRSHATKPSTKRRLDHKLKLLEERKRFNDLGF